MVKAFLIQPMNGRSEKEILDEREIMRMIFEVKGITLIDSYITGEPKSNNIGLWYLGKSIEMMADADVVCLLPGWDKNRGCKLEYECAKNYEMTILEIYYVPGEVRWREKKYRKVRNR